MTDSSTPIEKLPAAANLFGCYPFCVMTLVKLEARAVKLNFYESALLKLSSRALVKGRFVIENDSKSKPPAENA